MIYYHGGPITPDPCAIATYEDSHACVSKFETRQLGLVQRYARSHILDNGAFSYWKNKQPVDWRDFYAWVRENKNHPGFDWAVVPDVIEGTEEENDALLAEWPFRKDIGAAVWHTNESLDRLVRLAHSWPRVAIGSSGEFDAKSPNKLVQHLKNTLFAICDYQGRPICKLHGLRMLNPKIFTRLPLASADSTNVAINIKLDSAWKGTYQPKSKETRARVLVERIQYYRSAESLYDDQSVVDERVTLPLP